MKAKEKIFVLLLGLSLKSVLAITDSQKISALEKRVESLEATLDALEPLFVARYGLIRNCLVPTVPNGEAQCPEKLKPGARCSVVCNPGYIATPGKDDTSCKEDGFWTVDLQCEIPLVIVSGGTVDQTNGGDSGVELISFYPSKGCDRNIADMPLAGGSSRTLHNLVFVPPQRVLACNGMTSKNEATCDALNVRDNTWKHQSYPNKGSKLMGNFCDMDFGGRSSSSFGGMTSDCFWDRSKGRYASESLHVGGETYMVGGMVYDGSGHDLSNTVRYLTRLDEEYWTRRGKLDKKRAFFCSVKVKEGGFLSIGGLSPSQKGNMVEKSVEFNSAGYRLGAWGLKSISKFSDMITPRSGHACTGVPGNDFSVLVSGGTKGFDQTAIADSELFDWKTNSWKNVASMKAARFGHAVVAVGEKIFAIGGDDRNPNNILDTIEEYNVNENSWKIIKRKLKKGRSNFGYTLVPHSIFDGCVVSRPLNE